MSQSNHASRSKKEVAEQLPKQQQKHQRGQRSRDIMRCSFVRFRCILKTLLLAGLFLGSFRSTTHAIWNFRDYYLSGMMPTLKSMEVSKNTTAASQPTAYFYNQQYPVQYISEPPKPSLVHCVGETYDRQGPNPTDLDFAYRSCVYQNMCLNLTTSRNSEHAEFILVLSNHPRHRHDTNHNMNVTSWSNVQQQYQHDPVNSIESSTMDDWHFNHSKSVSLGAMAAGWTPEERKRIKWFPRVVTPNELAEQGVEGYYQLDPSVTLVPFVWHGAANPGHVLWDNLLPVYNLLTMFGLWPTDDTLPQPNVKGDTTNTTSPLLFIKMPVQGFLFGACTRHIEKVPCQTMMEKLLPLVGLSPSNLMDLRSTNEATLGTISENSTLPSSSTNSTSTLVCASQAVAGLGMLSDHGWKEHGQYHHIDYATLHNVGKSDLVYQFRNMILRKMGIVESPIFTSSPPYRITIAANSTLNKERLLPFTAQHQAIEAAFSSDMVTIQRLAMRDLSLVEQLRLATRSLIYISACGGGVMTATFLPRGASLILFFPSHRRKTRHTKYDYDLFNNMAYLRVHWIPIMFMNEPVELELLVLLIQSELDRVTAMRQDEQQQQQQLLQ